MMKATCLSVTKAGLLKPLIFDGGSRVVRAMIHPLIPWEVKEASLNGGPTWKCRLHLTDGYIYLHEWLAFFTLKK